MGDIKIIKMKDKTHTCSEKKSQKTKIWKNYENMVEL